MLLLTLYEKFLKRFMTDLIFIWVTIALGQYHLVHDPSGMMNKNDFLTILFTGKANFDGYDCKFESWYVSQWNRLAAWKLYLSCTGKYSQYPYPASIDPASIVADDGTHYLLYGGGNDYFHSWSQFSTSYVIRSNMTISLTTGSIQHVMTNITLLMVHTTGQLIVKTACRLLVMNGLKLLHV